MYEIYMKYVREKIEMEFRKATIVVDIYKKKRLYSMHEDRQFIWKRIYMFVFVCLIKTFFLKPYRRCCLISIVDNV